MHRFQILVLALAVVTCLGCAQSSDHPDTPTVEGTVTMDGEPLANAVLVFVPMEEARESYGRTDEQGRYELYYTDEDKGAVAGEHRVRITTAGGGDEDAGIEATAETVPAKYNVNSELVEEVKPGSNTINFELTSEGEIIEETDADQ